MAHSHASSLGRACALPEGRGFGVGRRGWLVGRSTVPRSLLTFVGRLRGGRVTVLFVDMVVGGRSPTRCRQPVGRCLRFDPCTPGWFGVGRLACGLFKVKWRLKLRCGRCAVVLAASWSAWFVWVSSPCCRWPSCRMLFVQPARPCRRWLVASSLVQGQRSAVGQHWLAAFVMVELRCSIVFVGMVVSWRGA